MNKDLGNPFWFALRTEHAHLARGNGCVRRYPADVIPFAGLEEPSKKNLLALRDLLEPEERVFIAADAIPEVDGMSQISELPGLQLHFHGDAQSLRMPEFRSFEIHRLAPDDAPAMVALTDIAFPGFFRERTYELGAYFGVFQSDHLIAMAGERIAVPGMREISAVCTHPKHTGRGYATALILHLLRFHAEQQLRSFLHVALENERAVNLYKRLGFVTIHALQFRQLQRNEA